MLKRGIKIFNVLLTTIDVFIMAFNLFLSGFVLNNDHFSNAENHSSKRKIVIGTIKYPPAQKAKGASFYFCRKAFLPTKIIFHFYSTSEEIKVSFHEGFEREYEEDIPLLNQSFLI